MNEQISKIKNELETKGKYDLTLSRLLNEIILRDKDPDKLSDELKTLQSDYDHYLDLLDSLNLNDDLIDVLLILIGKIDVYKTIELLIKQLKNHNKVSSISEQIPYFKKILNMVQENPGISKTDLITTMNVDSDILAQVLNEIKKLGLINVSSYKEQGNQTYYFLTAKGFTYNKLLNKEN